jgi:hypothetical protein
MEPFDLSIVLSAVPSEGQFECQMEVKDWKMFTVIGTMIGLSLVFYWIGDRDQSKSERVIDGVLFGIMAGLLLGLILAAPVMQH